MATFGMFFVLFIICVPLLSLVGKQQQSDHDRAKVPTLVVVVLTASHP